MFRKYGIAILAIVIAAASSAFTTPGNLFKPQVSYPFHYEGANFLQGSVQTNSNWKPGPGSGCGSTQNKACKMDVADTYTQDNGSGTQVLRTTAPVLSITAQLGANLTDYVPQAQLNAISGINNKP